MPVDIKDCIEAMSDGVVICDADDRIQLWNARYLAIFPHVADLVRVGMPFRSLIEAAIERAWPELTPEEQAVRLNLRLRHHGKAGARWQQTLPDGRIVEFAEHRSGGGGIVCVYRDMTEIRRSAARLAASEARFGDAIECMSDGLTLWDGDDRLLLWNRRYVELFPHQADLLRVGMTFPDLITAALRVNWREASAVEIETRVAARLALRRRLGETHEVEIPGDQFLALAESRTTDGGILSNYRDMTAERRSLARLRRSEADARRLALVAATTHGAVAILDPQSRIEWVNPAFTRLTGYSPDEAIGRSPREILIGPESAPDALARIAAGINAREPVCVEIAMHRKDGSVFWIELDASPIIGADGALECIVGVHVDITERKRHQAELERALANEREANARHRRFVAIASHEFRTPLTIIDGAAQRVLRRLGASDPALVEPLGRIRGAVARMTEIMERTLSSARLDEGRIEFRPQRIDLASLLLDVIDRQRQLSPGFEIVAALDPTPIWIEADPKLLDQVFTNLLSNAAKYSGESRRIEVAIDLSDATVSIAVRDWGLGIAADELPKLFTRFFRARTATGIPGTGIGLHLIKELLAMHAGDVAVASELGAGSVFTVRLPRRLAAQADAA